VRALLPEPVRALSLWEPLEFPGLFRKRSKRRRRLRRSIRWQESYSWEVLDEVDYSPFGERIGLIYVRFSGYVNILKMFC
jgi:hypothetical protein